MRDGTLRKGLIEKGHPTDEEFNQVIRNLIASCQHLVYVSNNGVPVAIPDFYEARYQMALTWWYAREFDKALDLTGKVLETRPDYANGHVLMGQMRFAVDKCLERLETDHIDVLQLHNIKMEHVRDASIWQALREMKDEGLIGVWGAAFGPAIGWLYEAVELCERENDIGGGHPTADLYLVLGFAALLIGILWLGILGASHLL